MKLLNKVSVFAILLLAIIAMGCTSSAPQENQTTGPVDNQSTPQTPPPQQNQTPPQAQAPMLLVTDSENHRILKVTFDSEKSIEWQYGCATVNNLDRCSTEKLYKPSSATKAGTGVIIADRENNRVIEVSEDKEVLRTITTAGDRGLWYPNYAVKLSNGDILIADGFNNRIVELDDTGEIVWQYGCAKLNSAGKCGYGTGPDELRNPRMVELLSDGNTLITDSENSRIIELDENKSVVWEYKSGLNIPYAAHKLSNGNVLIANTKANSVIEVDTDGNIVWELKKGLSFPTDAIRLATGDTLIADSYNNRIIEVNEAGEITWQYGDGKFGAAEGQLAKPSTALVI